MALGSRERVTIFRELLHVCGEWAIASGESQEWPLLSSGSGIPVVWHDSMGALSRQEVTGWFYKPLGNSSASTNKVHAFLRRVFKLLVLTLNALDVEEQFGCCLCK